MVKGLVERIVCIWIKLNVTCVLSSRVLLDRIKQRLVQLFCDLVEDIVNVVNRNPLLYDHLRHCRNGRNVLL